MSSIRCHQYATGRGTSGYGFVAFSRDGDSERPSYTFSLKKSVGLRFSQMPDGTDYVLEIDPVSTDYRHTGAFLTKKREEAGSVSIYTHVLITADDQPQFPEIFGLLKEENFLTPDEFSELTHNQRTLEMEDKGSDFERTVGESLNSDQQKTLGEFLARYWRLLEQREWTRGNDKAEIALLLPGKDIQDKVAVFANEIVKRLPEYVRPAVSVSFGTQWSNKGSIPCVCCVLPDENENPFPSYDLINGRSNNKRVGTVETAVGELLLRGDEKAYPEIYRRITELAKTDDRFRNMARGFTAMAFIVSEDILGDTDDPIQKRKDIYEKLLNLAEARYGIRKDEIQFELLPILIKIFEQINRQKSVKQEEKEWLIREGISLHLLKLEESEKQKLSIADQQIVTAYESLDTRHMTVILSELRGELEKKGHDSDECFAYLAVLEKVLQEKICNQSPFALVKIGLDQCNRLVRDVPEKAGDLISGYKGWLLQSQNRYELLTILQKSTAIEGLDESLLLDLLDPKAAADIEDADNMSLYLTAMQTARRRNAGKVDELLAGAYQEIITKAADFRGLSDIQFNKIAEYALSQKQTLETITPAIGFAVRNSQQHKQNAADYLEKLKIRMADSKEADDKAFREHLLTELDGTFKPFDKNPEQDDEAIRILLEKSGNKIPGGLANIERFKKRRLIVGLNEFIGTCRLDKENIIREKWDNNEKEKYDCGWNELTKEEITEPLELRMKHLFTDSNDRIGFLEEIHRAIAFSSGSAYDEALKEAWIRLLRIHYDDLWKNPGTVPDIPENSLRIKLDNMVEESGDEGLIDQCKRTNAGHARVFLKELDLCLGEDHNLGKQPEAIGRLIKKLHEERELTEYIHLDESIGKEKISNLNTLAQALLKGLSKPQSHEGAYWTEVLDSMKEEWKEKNDSMRKLNLLAFIMHNLKEMNAAELGKDLKLAIGENELAELWSDKMDQTVYCGNGKKVLNGTLISWLQNI